MNASEKTKMKKVEEEIKKGKREKSRSLQRSK